jgi:hypothetical protein
VVVIGREAYAVARPAAGTAIARARQPKYAAPPQAQPP